MTPIIHRVNNPAMLKDIPSAMGIEVDVRSKDGKIILSHEINEEEGSFSDFLHGYNHELLVINIKEAGTEKEIINILDKNKIEKYFLLDIEFPFLLQNHVQHGNNLSVRFSKYESIETVNNFSKSVNWLWIDTYEDFEMNDSIARIIKNFNTCLVSPSRWGQPDKLSYFINKFEKFNIHIDYVMIENGESI